MLIRFHKNQFPSPCISIASITLELLEWVKTKTGVGTIICKKNYKPGIHEDSYTYTAKYDNAIKLLELIKPYLVIKQKKQRAHLIIGYYKQLTPRNGIYSKEQLQAKEDFYTKFMAL